jgi:hypothetical protein
MADLEFDLEKTFHENMEVFKKHLVSIDPTLTELLFKHIDKIKFTGDPAQDRDRRTEFNNCVQDDLQILLTQTEIS